MFFFTLGDSFRFFLLFLIFLFIRIEVRWNWFSLLTLLFFLTISEASEMNHLCFGLINWFEFTFFPGTFCYFFLLSQELCFVLQLKMSILNFVQKLTYNSFCFFDIGTIIRLFHIRESVNFG